MEENFEKLRKVFDKARDKIKVIKSFLDYLTILQLTQVTRN